MIAKEDEGLYKLKGKPEQALVHESIEPSELEIQVKHEGICKGCAQGKNAKKTFPSSERKAKGILEIVHLDVCGPIPSSSLSGYVYYVLFIDDFSHNTWIYLLKGKSEVFSKFKEYKALVEN